MKKFNQARVNGGSNYDSTVAARQRVMRAARKRRPLVVGPLGGSICDTVKVRGVPKARRYQASAERRGVAGVVTRGTVTTRRDVTMDDPQPSPRRRAARVQFNDWMSVGPAGPKIQSVARREAWPRVLLR